MFLVNIVKKPFNFIMLMSFSIQNVWLRLTEKFDSRWRNFDNVIPPCSNVNKLFNYYFKKYV